MWLIQQMSLPATVFSAIYVPQGDIDLRSLSSRSFITAINSAIYYRQGTLLSGRVVTMLVNTIPYRS